MRLFAVEVITNTRVYIKGEELGEAEINTDTEADRGLDSLHFLLVADAFGAVVEGVAVDDALFHRSSGEGVETYRLGLYDGEIEIDDDY